MASPIEPSDGEFRRITARHQGPVGMVPALDEPDRHPVSRAQQDPDLGATTWPSSAVHHARSSRAWLARVLAAAAELAVAGTWARVKACRNRACQLGFYDRSRNASAACCSPDRCRAQVAMRAYRARRTGGAQA